MIEMCIPSSLDPTVAPEGCHVISLFTQYTPYELKDGKQWDQDMKDLYCDRGKQWRLNEKMGNCTFILYKTNGQHAVHAPCTRPSET